MSSYTTEEQLDTAVSILRDIAYELRRSDPPMITAATLVAIARQHLNTALDCLATGMDEL